MSHDNPSEKAHPGSGEAPAAAMEVIEHTRCRLCGSEDLDDIHSFGDFYVSNFVDEAHSREGVKAPLDLIMCNRCSLLQLRHTAPMELMYARHYWYRSGVTETMRTALRDVSATIEEMVGLGPGDVVLDIGANDGTLLALPSRRNPLPSERTTKIPSSSGVKIPLGEHDCRQASKEPPRKSSVSSKATRLASGLTAMS